VHSFFEWFRTENGGGHPWLLLGKGPGFARRGAYDLRGFRTFGLNHVCREMTVDVAHAIDLDVVDQCGPRLLDRVGVLVMPWHPHVPDPHRPHWAPRKAIAVSERTLEEIAAGHPVLRQLVAEQRLLWYNSSTARTHRPDSPVVPVRFFSAVAALNLLGMAGARTVRSLGIDGGRSYSGEFADLEGVTKLAGGQRSFDLQFEEMARGMMKTGVSYAGLGVETPIRVFVGATPPQDLAVRVLEYSIRVRTPMDVEVVPLYRTGVTVPEARDPRNRSRTPFSFQRFLIPAAAGYRGRAFYLDSDMLVLDDLRSVWSLPFGDAEVLAIRTQAKDPTARFSVLLLDCERLRWDINEIVASLDRGTLTYAQLMFDMNWGPRVSGDIDARWNSLDTYRAGETGLLHYTDGTRQPWLSAEHPLGYLWMRELIAALDSGFITIDEIETAVRAGHVRPSLLFQVRERLEDPLLLPRRVRRQDLFFVEPSRLRPWTRRSRVSRLAMMARAGARRVYRGSPLFRLHQWIGDRR
jgi:hypothetical protein